MKKITLLFALLLSVFVGYSQKTIVDANAEKRQLNSFSSIEVAHGIRLILSKGAEQAVAVSAEKEEHVKRIKTEVVNGVLKIYYQHPAKTKLGKKKETVRNLKAYVSYTELKKLKASTGAVVETVGILSANQLEISLSTGAKMEGEVDIRQLSFSQSTGSKTILKGKVSVMDLEGSTGSKFNGTSMEIAQCSVDVTTGAIYEVKVNESLNAKASSGGKVFYTGKAKNTHVKTSSGGKISKK